MFVAVLWVLSVTAMPGAAGDWPQWRGPQHDGISRETGLISSWPEGGPQELWRATLGKGFSGVSVVGANAYTMYSDGGDEYVTCLDVANGKPRWRVRSGDTFEDSLGDGPRATPTVHEGRVYSHGATGSVLCLDAETGDKRWGLNSLETCDANNIGWGLSASPLVLGDRIIIVVGGQAGKSLVALQKDSGQTVWTSLDDKAGYATPILIEVDGMKQIVVFTATAVVGVRPADGAELWRYRWETNEDANVAQPVFHGNRLFISSGFDSGAAMLELTVQDGRTTVSEIWRSRGMKNYMSSCVLFDGYLYGFSNTILTCMDFQTGEVRWTQRGFYRGSLLAADGKLIIYSERAKLVLAEISPESFNQLAVATVLSGKTWTVPTLSNGRLFVRNDKELVCLKFTP
jgi:outer membrane protein assembly factor BamB